MRELLSNQLKLECNKFQGELEKLEGEISAFGIEFAEEQKIKKVAQMICNEDFNRQNLIGILAANK